MNKTFALLILLTIAMPSSAQLTVAEDGKVYVQRSTEDSIANLGIGESSFYDSQWYGQNNIGVLVHKYGANIGKNCYGIYSEAIRGTGETIGVLGYGWGSTDNYGVLGTIDPNSNGAGVCGTEEGATPPPFTGSYAGYFFGGTYTDGAVISNTGFYNYSDIRLKENVCPIGEKENNKRVLEKIERMEVLEYNLKRPWQLRQEEKGGSREMTDRDKALMVKRHFGISAQELQKLYPELVEEGQEGYLMVNYVELIPVLIRSIQELKAELDEIKDPSNRNLTRSGKADDVETTQCCVFTDSILYQNTPNPFHERTTIGFHLADDAHNAQICIFDLSGKLIKKLPVMQGMESVTVGGWELGEGMFLYSLIANGQVIDTKRMVITE